MAIDVMLRGSARLSRAASRRRHECRRRADVAASPPIFIACFRWRACRRYVEAPVVALRMVTRRPFSRGLRGFGARQRGEVGAAIEGLMRERGALFPAANIMA